MTFRLVFVAILLCACDCASPEDGSKPGHYDVIVVGLGASGVTAATTLAKNGKRVLGLEASDRVGGRVRTVPFGENLVEMGAEWIHGTEDSRVYEIAQANNITTTSQAIDLTYYYSNGTRASKQVYDQLVSYSMDLLEDVAAGAEPEPVGRYILNRFYDSLHVSKSELLNDQPLLDNFIEFANLLVSNYMASNDWNDVNVWTEDESLRGDLHMSWARHGYKTLFEILLNKYNNGPGLPNLHTEFNKEVVQIIQPATPAQDVVVKCRDGSEYTARSVIVTVSLGVLQERYTTLFSPQLPECKVEAIKAISMGLMDKIILAFEKPWWPKETSMFGFIWTAKEREQVPKEDEWTTKIYGASRPMASNNVLTLWTNGDVAKLVETLPADVVKSKIMELLRKFMGGENEIPEPTDMIRSTWYSNPYTRGSYTYDNVDSHKHPTARTDLGAPLIDSASYPRILFAGEATTPKHSGTVHGAMETGLREAHRILDT